MITLQDKIETYLDNREMRGFSRNPHGILLQKYWRYIVSNNGNLEILTEDDVKGWLYANLSDQSKDISIAAGAIRGLGRYLLAIGEDSYLLPYKYGTYRTTFSPRILTDDELARFFKATDELPNITGHPKTSKFTDSHTATAAPVIYRLLYTSGLRPNEGRLLERSNIDFQSGTVKIIDTKFHKDRTIVISDDMLSLCKRYDDWRSDLKIESKYFFCNKGGQYFGNNWLSVVIRKIWRRANPETAKSELSYFRPYDLRHRFATANIHRWMDEGADLDRMLQYLKVYMGHTELAHTAYYMHILPEKLAHSPGVNWELLDALIPEVKIWEN